MSEMVEQVALAMALSDGDYEVMDHWRRRAQAAIEAMREPTSEMINAVETYTGSTPDTLVTSWHQKRIWQGMIDTALENKPA